MPKYEPYNKAMYNLPYPNNLIDKLFGADYHIAHPTTDDQQAAIDYIINTALTQRDRDVIALRFQQHKTLRECAKELSCTGENVRHYETRLLYTLSKPVYKTAISMGYRAFYEQDINKLYTERQAMLNQSLNQHRDNLPDNIITLLNHANIITVGDCLLRTLSDFRDILGETNAVPVIRLQAGLRTALAAQNQIIAEIEAARNKQPVSDELYPNNLFNILFGYNLTGNLSSNPTQSQIDGLNSLQNLMLTKTQQRLIQYRYMQNMSIAQCAKHLKVTKSYMINELYIIIRKLRQEPGCNMYLYGTTSLQDVGQPASMLVKTQGYLTHIDIQPTEQITFLSAIPVDNLHLTNDQLVTLKSNNINTALEALMSDNIDRNITHKIHTEVCMIATKLENIGLSNRSYNALRRAGIRTLQSVCNMTDTELLAINNLGVGSLLNIRGRINAVMAMMN